MQKIIMTAALMILIALTACSNPAQATRAPTPSSVPTPTRAPFPTQEPTAATASTAGPPAAKPTTVPSGQPAPEPTSILARKDEMQAGVLSPLNLYETDDINSEISEAELACLKEGGPFLHLRWEFILPGPGDREQRVMIIACLEDETLARIFLADIAQGVGPLSLETSTCVRAAFNEIDPRSMLLAKVEGYPEDTLNAATTAWLVTLACLRDDEWETAARSLREDSGPRELMRCMMEKLGGPGEMAATMTKGERGDQEALAEAAADCAEETGPVPGETPAAPTATPESASTSEPGSIAPLDPNGLKDLLWRLTQTV